MTTRRLTSRPTGGEKGGSAGPWRGLRGGGDPITLEASDVMKCIHAAIMTRNNPATSNV